MKRELFSLVVIFICLGLVSCDGTGGGPTDTSMYGPAVLFAETWESYSVGSFPGGGWLDAPQPYFQKKVSPPAADHKMLLEGPSTNTAALGGIYYALKPGTMKPTYIRYNIHPYPQLLDPAELNPNYMIGNVRLAGEHNGYTLIGYDAHFRHNGLGNGFFVANGIRYNFDPPQHYSIDNAFLIELRNIHWDTPPTITYDLWVNGVEIETCIPFINPIESIEVIFIFNSDYGKIHIDNIFMADLPYRNTCIVIDEPAYPDTMPLPPPPSPSPLDEPVIFIIDIPAFCQAGPGVDYHKLSTFQEGTQLEITGQNIEGTWWYSEKADCWISDQVGGLVGDFRTLDILLPPPPPVESEPSEGEPGKVRGCKSGLGKAACIEAGGTWGEQPGQPETCVCP